LEPFVDLALAAALAFHHLNVTLADGAIEALQSRGLWTPSIAALNGLEPMFGNNFNGTLESEKFAESDLDINELVHLGVNEYPKRATNVAVSADETGLAKVDVCIPSVHVGPGWDKNTAYISQQLPKLLRPVPQMRGWMYRPYHPFHLSFPCLFRSMPKPGFLPRLRLAGWTRSMTRTQSGHFKLFGRSVHSAYSSYLFLVWGWSENKDRNHKRMRKGTMTRRGLQHVAFLGEHIG
jgi:hypothetical protein